MHDEEEFYIGYQPAAPPGIQRRLGRAIVALLLAIVLLGLIFAVSQQRLPAAYFEYGELRDFEGVVRERPIPTLTVARPQGATNVPSESRYTLVAEGKHGAASEVTGFEGRRVKLRGTLIYRDGVTMIELSKGSIEVIPAGGDNKPRVARDWLGIQTLAGEIVDSKCYLGIMNPGSRTPHRECAERCISGGIPPLFVVENSEGERAALWLTTPEGTGVGREVLGLIAKPVEIIGEVVREGDQLYLRSDPRAYRVLARSEASSAH